MVNKLMTNRGYVAISTVLLTVAVVIAVMITVSQLGIGEGQGALALTKGESALHFSEGCMEDALLKIRANASYTGGSITRPEGTCTIAVAQVGNVYTVTATSTATDYRRSFQAVVTRSTTALAITSWKEQ